jgi:alpha-tubulin suppressor-like RCC1 family protein
MPGTDSVYCPCLKASTRGARRVVGLLAAASAVITACGKEPTAPVDSQAQPALATSAGLLTFRQISAGQFHTCGVTSDNRAFCWGQNESGQLGNGSQDNDSVPVPVAGGLQFIQVSAGVSFSCGVTATNRAYCWGINSFGQLGNGSTSRSPTPVAVAGGLRFREVRAGSLHACGRTTIDEAYCWGNDTYGQLGDSSTLQRSLRPVKVAGGHRFFSVTAGGFSDQGLSCGVTHTNRGYCWGYGAGGQIGDGKTLIRRWPRLVTGDLHFTDLDAGTEHACAVGTDARAWCWGAGANNFGQIGDGTFAGRPKPSPVVGGISFRRIEAGEFHSCGVATSGAGYCWGQGYYGALGNGDPLGGADHASPVAVAGGLVFAAITAGKSHSCGVTTGGQGYCWGANNAGQLGTGSTVPALAPVPVAAPR